VEKSSKGPRTYKISGRGGEEGTKTPLGQGVRVHEQGKGGGWPKENKKLIGQKSSNKVKFKQEED